MARQDSLTRPVGIPAGFLTQTIATKRSPAASGGIVGSMATELENVPATELLPLDPALRDAIPELAVHVRSWQLFVGDDVDIQEGDRVVIGSSEYPVQYVELWPWLAGTTYKRVVVTERMT